MNDILEILRSSDSFAAIGHIQRDGSPVEIAERYDTLIRDLYWRAHDLPAVITIGRAGITYCLSQRLIAGASQEFIGKMGNTAKLIAYNIGSFAWPGWEEPGINPTPYEIAVGLDCAKLNLRLAIELHRPPKGISKAHWLIGAYGLAIADFQSALQEFTKAQQVIPPTDPAYQELEPCNSGYHAIAQLGLNPKNTEAIARFDNFISQLETKKDEDSQGYLSQLKSARRLFLKT